MEEITEDIENFNFDLSKKKKKKKVDIKEETKEEVKHEDTTENDNDYDYMFLLDRIKRMKPDISSCVNAKLVVPIPNMNKLTPKKVMFVNFSDTVKVLNRPSEHVQLFVSSELNAECSVDAMSRLIIRGKYSSRNLESIIKKYIIEYVVCNECNKTDTSLVKDPITRLSFVKCGGCKSSRSVSNISLKK
jgi:translation initiation factor 2 subunit 2